MKPHNGLYGSCDGRCCAEGAFEGYSGARRSKKLGRAGFEKNENEKSDDYSWRDAEKRSGVVRLWRCAWTLVVVGHSRRSPSIATLSPLGVATWRHISPVACQPIGHVHALCFTEGNARDMTCERCGRHRRMCGAREARGVSKASDGPCACVRVRKRGAP